MAERQEAHVLPHATGSWHRENMQSCSVSPDAPRGFAPFAVVSDASGAAATRPGTRTQPLRACVSDLPGLQAAPAACCRATSACCGAAPPPAAASRRPWGPWPRCQRSWELRHRCVDGPESLTVPAIYSKVHTAWPTRWGPAGVSVVSVSWKRFLNLPHRTFGRLACRTS